MTSQLIKTPDPEQILRCNVCEDYIRIVPRAYDETECCPKCKREIRWNVMIQQTIAHLNASTWDSLVAESFEEARKMQ